jgi:hypothetical protein
MRPAVQKPTNIPGALAEQLERAGMYIRTIVRSSSHARCPELLAMVRQLGLQRRAQTTQGDDGPAHEQPQPDRD